MEHIKISELPLLEDTKDLEVAGVKNGKTYRAKLDGKADKINIADYFDESKVLPYPAAYSWYSQLPHFVSFRKDADAYLAFCAAHNDVDGTGYYFAFFKREDSYVYYGQADYTNPDDEWYQLGLRVFNEDLRARVEALEERIINLENLLK